MQSDLTNSIFRNIKNVNNLEDLHIKEKDIIFLAENDISIPGRLLKEGFNAI